MGKVVKIKDMALDGLHGEVEKVFLSLNLDRDSEILILGSGEGFADSWLLKNNYKNITSVDLYTENKLKDKVNFIKLDLNEKSFHKSINKKFDVIICIEIIEHVFNTKDFLENVSYLTKKNCKLLISSPNVHSKVSRVDYLITGYPHLFIEKPTMGGHINPIFINMLSFFCNINKFRIKKVFGFGGIFDYVKAYDKVSFRSYIYLFVLVALYFLLNPLMVVNRKQSKNLINIFLIER